MSEHEMASERSRYFELLLRRIEATDDPPAELFDRVERLLGIAPAMLPISWPFPVADPPAAAVETDEEPATITAIRQRPRKIAKPVEPLRDWDEFDAVAADRQAGKPWPAAAVAFLVRQAQEHSTAFVVERTGIAGTMINGWRRAAGDQQRSSPHSSPPGPASGPDLTREASPATTPTERQGGGAPGPVVPDWPAAEPLTREEFDAEASVRRTRAAHRGAPWSVRARAFVVERACEIGAGPAAGELGLNRATVFGWLRAAGRTSPLRSGGQPGDPGRRPSTTSHELDRVIEASDEELAALEAEAADCLARSLRAVTAHPPTVGPASSPPAPTPEALDEPLTPTTAEDRAASSTPPAPDGPSSPTPAPHSRPTDVPVEVLEQPAMSKAEVGAKRYTVEQRDEILDYAADNGVAPASRHFGCSEMTIRRWQTSRGKSGFSANALPPRGESPAPLAPKGLPLCRKAGCGAPLRSLCEDRRGYHEACAPATSGSFDGPKAMRSEPAPYPVAEPAGPITASLRCRTCGDDVSAQLAAGAGEAERALALHRAMGAHHRGSPRCAW